MGRNGVDVTLARQFRMKTIFSLVRKVAVSDFHSGANGASSIIYDLVQRDLLPPITISRSRRPPRTIPKCGSAAVVARGSGQSTTGISECSLIF